RVTAHEVLLRSAYPADGRRMRAWLRNPVGAIAGLSFWSDSNGGGVRRVRWARKRLRPVRRPRPTHDHGRPPPAGHATTRLTLPGVQSGGSKEMADRAGARWPPSRSGQIPT